MFTNDSSGPGVSFSGCSVSAEFSVPRVSICDKPASHSHASRLDEEGGDAAVAITAEPFGKSDDRFSQHFFVWLAAGVEAIIESRSCSESLSTRAVLLIAAIENVFPVFAFEFAVPLMQFPVSCRREKIRNALNSYGYWALDLSGKAHKCKISL